MKITKLSISLLLLLFISQNVIAQFEYKTRKDNYLINGPVYLYKKTVLKDFAQKFGEYEAGTKQMKEWYLYDEKGREIFECLDKTNPGSETAAYGKSIYYFNNDRLKIKAYTFIIGDEKEEDFRLTYYQYPPQGNIMEEYYTSIYDGEKMKGFTKKYNSENLLVEETEYLGKEGGYKKTHEYDKNGYEISYTEYNGIGDLRKKIFWERDNKGNLLEKIKYDAGGKIIEKEIHKYNNAGKLIENVVYNSNDSEHFGLRINYLDDALAVYIKISYSGEIHNEYKLEYDNKKRKIKEVYSVYNGDKTNRYVVFEYDNDNHLIKIKSFKNQELIEKSVYSNYEGNQYLLYTKETYNVDGSINEIITETNDKYGNTVAYEKYRYETKFGEKVKIPIEKHEFEIAYYDGTPKLEIQMEIVREKFTKKGKKENVFKIEIKNAKVEPKIHFYDLPGITKYNGTPNRHIEAYSFRTQYDFHKSFYKPYFIIEAGNEILLVKTPNK